MYQLAAELCRVAQHPFCDTNGSLSSDEVLIVHHFEDFFFIRVLARDPKVALASAHLGDLGAEFHLLAADFRT